MDQKFSVINYVKKNNRKLCEAKFVLRSWCWNSKRLLYYEVILKGSYNITIKNFSTFWSIFWQFNVWTFVMSYRLFAYCCCDVELYIGLGLMEEKIGWFSSNAWHFQEGTRHENIMYRIYLPWNNVQKIKRRTKAPIWITVNYKKNIVCRGGRFFTWCVVSTAKTVAHLFYIVTMSLLIRMWRILLHSSRSAIFKSWTVNGSIGLTAMHRPRVSQKCSFRYYICQAC